MDDLPTKTLSAPGEKAENFHPGGMAESLGERSQLMVGFVAFDRP